MDQTFFVFLILFGIIIIYLFKQKQDQEDLKEELTQYVNQEHFENMNDESNLSNIEINSSTPPEPMNKPIAPVGNGYSSTLNYSHPQKINGCDINSVAPMDYYKEMNQKLNNQFNNKVMNGDIFGEVTGYTDDSDEGYYFVE